MQNYHLEFFPIGLLQWQNGSKYQKSTKIGRKKNPGFFIVGFMELKLKLDVGRDIGYIEFAFQLQKSKNKKTGIFFAKTCNFSQHQKIRGRGHIFGNIFFWNTLWLWNVYIIIFPWNMQGNDTKTMSLAHTHGEL